MFLFHDELRALVTAVHARKSAQVVSSSGIGASTLLRALSDELTQNDYAVISVRGVAYARQIEFLALRQADSGPGTAGGARTLAALLERSTAYLRSQPRRAIVIDGIEHVDRGTLAVLQAAAAETSTPVVLSRSRDVRSMMNGGSFFTQFSGPRIELKPLDFVSTAALVQEHLGHWPDPEVASRVFAKSAGITGLIVAVVAGAKANGLLRLVDDRWVMAGENLWSGEVESWIEAHLAMLSPVEYDALELIARGHSAPQSSPATQLEPAALKALDSLGLLAAAADSAGSGLAVHPPSLSDYFRRSLGSSAVRRYLDEDGAGDPGPGHLSSSVAEFRRAAEHRVLEHARVWSEAPTVASALPYLASLLDTPRTERTVREVFDRTPLSSAVSGDEAFDFAFVHRQWVGIADRRMTPGIDYDSVATLFPAWSDAITRFRAAMNDVALPEAQPRADADFAATMPGGAIWMASYAFASLHNGDVEAARYWVSRVPASDQRLVRNMIDSVDAIALFASGDYLAALESSRRSSAAARVDLDHSAILLHSYTHALALIALARWAEARQVVADALAYGPPGVSNGAVYRALLNIGAVASLGAGDLQFADRLIADAEQMEMKEWRLPGMQREVPAMIRALADGDHAAAMRTLRALADRISDNKSPFTAELSLSFGLMAWPEIATLDQLESVLDGAGIAYAADVHWVLRQSFANLADAAEAARGIVDPSKIPFVTQVLESRVRQDTQRGIDVSRAVAALRHLGTSAAADDRATADQFASHEPHLTAREHQVALLVRSHTNAEIAAQLTVSVRTVENHLHSAMKKYGVSSRLALYDRIAVGRS